MQTQEQFSGKPTICRTIMERWINIVAALSGNRPQSIPNAGCCISVQATTILFQQALKLVRERPRPSVLQMPIVPNPMTISTQRWLSTYTTAQFAGHTSACTVSTPAQWSGVLGSRTMTPGPQVVTSPQHQSIVHLLRDRTTTLAVPGPTFFPTWWASGKRAEIIGLLIRMTVTCSGLHSLARQEQAL